MGILVILLILLGFYLRRVDSHRTRKGGSVRQIPFPSQNWFGLFRSRSIEPRQPPEMMARAAVVVCGPCPGMAAEGMAGRMRRTQSSPQLRCSLAVARAMASPPESWKSGRSVGVLFPFGGIISNRIRSFMFEAEEEEEEESAGAGELRLVEEIEADAGKETRQRGNWVSRILELRRRWRDRQRRQQSDAKGEVEVEEEAAGEEDGCCSVSYEDLSPEAESGNQGEWDRESFARLLQPAAWSDTVLFSQLAFLCTEAYDITDIKVKLSLQSRPSISIPTPFVSSQKQLIPQHWPRDYLFIMHVTRTHSLRGFVKTRVKAQFND